MQVNLPDLGPNFAVEPLNEGNRFRAKAVSGTFTIRPGVYLLSRQSSKVDLEGLQLPVAVGLREFYAPPSSDAPATVWHEPVREWVEGKPLRLTFTVASPREPERVMLYLWHESARVFRSIPLERKRAYRYEATIPSNWLKPGEIEYLVGVKLGQKFQTFPFDLGREPVRERRVPRSANDFRPERRRQTAARFIHWTSAAQSNFGNRQRQRCRKFSPQADGYGVRRATQLRGR
jgi:hypothetical protein